MREQLADKTNFTVPSIREIVAGQGFGSTFLEKPRVAKDTCGRPCNFPASCVPFPDSENAHPDKAGAVLPQASPF